VFGFEAGR